MTFNQKFPFLHSCNSQWHPLQQHPFLNVYENTTGMSILMTEFHLNFHDKFLCVSALMQFTHSLRFWTFTKTPLVCQFWQEFHLNFQYKFLFVFLHWCSWQSPFYMCLWFHLGKSIRFKRLRKHQWYVNFDKFSSWLS